MTLLLDAMYPGRPADQLRIAGHDVLAVVELPELVGQPDAEVVRWARAEGRIVVTENIVDYARLDPSTHAGLLLVNAQRWPRTPAALPRLRAALVAWFETSAHDGEGTVGWL